MPGGTGAAPACNEPGPECLHLELPARGLRRRAHLLVTSYAGTHTACGGAGYSCGRDLCNGIKNSRI